MPKHAGPRLLETAEGAADETSGSVDSPKFATPPPAATTPSLLIEPLLTRADLAHMLRCSLPTIDRLKSAGRLLRPDLYLFRSPRWRKSSVETWIATQKGGRP
jgi:hypothetical protein